MIEDSQLENIAISRASNYYKVEQDKVREQVKIIQLEEARKNPANNFKWFVYCGPVHIENNGLTCVTFNKFMVKAAFPESARNKMCKPPSIGYDHKEDYKIIIKDNDWNDCLEVFEVKADATRRFNKIKIA